MPLILLFYEPSTNARLNERSNFRIGSSVILYPETAHLALYISSLTRSGSSVNANFQSYPGLTSEYIAIATFSINLSVSIFHLPMGFDYEVCE